MKRIFIHIGILGGTETHPRLRVQGKEMLEFTTISDAFLTIVDGLIAAFGPMSSLDLSVECPDEVIDLQGRSVLPAWCDPHTHIVYAGSRECEFVDKIRGLSYEEIACRGGGILNSADLLHLTDEDELYRQALQRAVEVMHNGTGCLEIKSGYGLNLDDELKMLRVIRRLRDALPMRVVSTFLGAHAVGRAYSHEEYVRLVIDEMIPEVGRQQLADYIDVFCDKGFFTPEETSRMLEAGAKWGMLPKIHAEELAASGGVRVGVAHRALSVDHLESMDITGIEVLSGSETMPTVLPGTSFFLNMPWAPARKMIEAGLGVAVASDYNPGSTPSGDMKFIVSLACIKLRLLPEEALNAATLNSAYAMGLSADYGSLAVGKVANFMVTAPIPSLAFIPYAYTTPLVEQVWLQGNRV